MAPVSDGSGWRCGRLHAGYDNAWIFSDWDGTLREVLTMQSPLTGISLKMATNQPSVQLYSGNFLNGTDSNSRSLAAAPSLPHVSRDLPPAAAATQRGLWPQTPPLRGPPHTAVPPPYALNAAGLFCGGRSAVVPLRLPQLGHPPAAAQEVADRGQRAAVLPLPRRRCDSAAAAAAHSAAPLRGEFCTHALSAFTSAAR